MDQRPKITVETLVRLKRAERPSTEFWSGFERELRQKQLTALLECRPWWQGLPRLLSRRAYLPVGATAVIAFTLVSIRYYTPRQVAPLNESSEVAAPAVQAPALQATDHDATTRSSAEPTASTVAAIPQFDDRTATADHALSESIPLRSAEFLPWSAPRQVEKPSDRMIAENVARLNWPGIELTPASLDRAPPNTSRTVEVATPGVELAAVSALASKRTRLLAELAGRRFTPEPQAPEFVRERLSRRLADPEYAERFSRIGVQGDRVLVKF